MTRDEAFRIVLDLALENVVDIEDNEEEHNRQHEAWDAIEALRIELEPNKHGY